MKSQEKFKLKTFFFWACPLSPVKKTNPSNQQLLQQGNLFWGTIRKQINLQGEVVTSSEKFLKDEEAQSLS